jgi:hypothetical protein
MDRRIATHHIKTVSEYPLLVGEILRRAELRNLRRSKWRAFLRRLTMFE